jgi:hypothetical protein
MATDYRHPSASNNQPAAESATAAHKVIASCAPTSGVAKLGFKGPGGIPADSASNYLNQQQQPVPDKAGA